MPDTTLYVDVEQVPSDLRSPSVLLLGVSLAIEPADLPSNASTPSVACPWTWDGIDQDWKNVTWNVYGQTGQNAAWTLLNSGNDGLNIDVYKLPTLDPNWQSAKARLLSLVDASLTSIKKSPDSNNATQPKDRQIKITNNSFGSQPDLGYGKKYLSLQWNLAAASFPLPQLLNLSCFLKITGLKNNYSSFLVLPSFHANGTPYAPETPPASNSSSWDTQSGALKMHSAFSNPIGGAVRNDLWLKPIASSNAKPLVTGWQSHLNELAGPYMDAAHLLTDPMNPAPMASLAMATDVNWLHFRECVLNALHDLVRSTDTPTPTLPDKTWRQQLRAKLGVNYADMSTLGDDNSPPKNFAAELSNLRDIVSAACSGNTLADLVEAETKFSVPISYEGTGKAPALLNLLQSRLIAAATIASICKDTDLKSVGTNLTNAIADHLSSKLNTVDHPETIVSGTMTFLGSRPYDELLRLALGTTDPANIPPLTNQMPPLVLPAFQAQVADVDNDPLRGIRGVSVLLRRNGPGKDKTQWACPGIASPVLGDSAVDGKLPVLVATRLFYNNQLRSGDQLLTGMLLYKNGPFACADILHEYMALETGLRHISAGEQNAAPGAGDIVPGSLLQYVSYEGGGPLHGTPTLRAGSTFDFACFAVSNSGALPPELRGLHPADLQLADPPANACTSGVPYYRTVAVGGLQTCNEVGDTPVNPSTPFPAIPPNVWPQAAEIDLKASGPSSQRPPLLLITPDRQNLSRMQGTYSQFQFSVRLPIVDPQTWYATNGYSFPTSDATKDTKFPKKDLVIDSAYRAMAENLTSGITDSLIQNVEFSLQQWDGNAWQAVSIPPKQIPQFTYDKLLDPATGPLSGASTLPIQVSVNGGSIVNADGSGGNDGTITLQITGQPSTIQTLATGFAGSGVYRLSATLNLHQKLTPRTMPNYPLSVMAYQLLIEIASATMPKSQDLLSPLRVELLGSDGLPDQQLRSRILAKDLPNVHRVDFLRQNWAWTGRVQPRLLPDPSILSEDLQPQGFPIEDPDGTLRPRWESIEFAERPAMERIERLSTLKMISTPKDGKVPCFELVEDLSLDPRAAYLRLAPRVYSRYQGLYRGGDWFVASPVGNVGRLDQWRSVFVRSRVRNLKMPRLKMLTPLTESTFAEGSPGVVAVFDGPAFDQAGLAETLRVEYVTVPDPDLDHPQNWEQVGPDFEMSDVVPLQNASDQHPPILVPIGPVGHTLDDISGIHKFISHSWIIRPKYDSKNGQDFAWWLAELQFHMEIVQEASVFPPSFDATTNPKTPKPIRSEKVTASWIQFLPGFHDSANRFDGWHFAIGAQKDLLTFSVTDAYDHPIAPIDSERHASRFLMVMRVVRDIAGIERESYFGVAAHQKGDSFWTLLPGFPIPQKPKFRVRMLYLRSGDPHHLVGSLDHGQFWKAVTAAAANDKDAPTDVQRAGPVNLSAAISQKGASQ